MDWKKQVIEDLRQHGQRADSLKNIKEKITAIEYQKSAVKAVTTDTDPVQGGGSSQEDRLLNLISEQERLKHTYRAAKRLVDLVENALNKLEPVERKVLDKFYIHRNKGYVEELMQELGYEKTQVYVVKDKALHKLTITMYGLAEY